jgi:hypothetical protein
MQTFRLRTRTHSAYALMAAAAASMAVLGGALVIFFEASQTPVFEPGSSLARQAELCQRVASMTLRHQCLREVTEKAEIASRRGAGNGAG